jgi:hypothetical protein
MKDDVPRLVARWTVPDPENPAQELTCYVKPAGQKGLWLYRVVLRRNNRIVKKRVEGTLRESDLRFTEKRR